jgi:hypothetical protein
MQAAAARAFEVLAGKRVHTENGSIWLRVQYGPGVTAGRTGTFELAFGLG